LKIIGGTPGLGYYKLYYNQIYTERLFLNESISTMQNELYKLGLIS